MACGRRGAHLDALDFDAPLFGGVVENLLHAVAGGLALRQDLRQRLRAEHVAQSGLRKQLRAVVRVLREAHNETYDLMTTISSHLTTTTAETHEERGGRAEATSRTGRAPRRWRR